LAGSGSQFQQHPELGKERLDRPARRVYQGATNTVLADFPAWHASSREAA